MRAVPSATMLTLLLLAGPGLAQSMSQPPAMLGSLPSATSPQPGAPPAAPPVDVDAPRTFLMAARQALTAGQSDAAREALEQAETRLLSRSVPRSLGPRPSGRPLVETIADARTALAAADRAGALQKVDEALKDPNLDAPTQ